MTRKAVKTRRQRRQVPRQKRRTNWLVIGSIIGGGVLILALLALLAMQEQTGDELADYCDENPGNCISHGPVDAPVTVVEVSDYGCNHCRDFNLETADLLYAEYVETGQVRWIVLPFAFGRDGNYPTMPSAVASLCGQEQGQYGAYSKALFALQGTPAFNTTAGFIQAAELLNMDVDALTSCVNSGRYEQTIMNNTAAAVRAGLTGTPAFFIDGRKFEGNAPLSVFQQRINSALRAGS